MKKNLTENYDSHTKEELLAECNLRGVEGVSSSSLKADIIAALELNDEQADTEPKVTKPLPSPVASNIPNVPKAPIVEDVSSPSYKDEDFDGGIFRMRERISFVDAEGNEKWKGTLHPGEVFALCKHNPDVYGRTHSLKNSVHFWEGSESQFQIAFERE